MRTVITYKQKEDWIFQEVESHSGKGNWVKDILADYINGKLVYADNSNQFIKGTTQPNGLDLSEFGNIFDKE